MSNPFIQLYFHWNVGRQTLLSPISFERPDPINEFANKLKQTGEKDDWLQGRKLEAKQRIYVPMIVRNKDNSVDMETGVKFWGFGKTMYEDLLKIILDPDYGDITDPITGRDIEVTYTPKEESDTNFPKTEILVKPKEVPVTEDEDQFADLMNSQIEITDIYQEKSYEELVEIFTNWLGRWWADRGLQLGRRYRRRYRYVEGGRFPNAQSVPTLLRQRRTTLRTHLQRCSAISKGP